MATLQDRIDLADGVSPALKRMVQAAELAAAKFQLAGQAAGMISRAANFSAAAADMRDVGNAAGAAVASINEIHVSAGMIPPPFYKAVGAAGDMNGELRQSIGILGNIKGALASTFAQFTLANLAADYLQQFIAMLSSAPGKLAALSDQYSGIIARLNLVTGSQEQTVALNDQIYASALRARGGYAEMADAVSKIAMTAKEAFPDPRQVVPFMEGVQKLFTIGGTDLVRQKDALLQLTQALGSGKLQGDEFRSIAEAAPMIEQMVARYMGVSQGALKELSSKGEITAQIMKNAILGSLDEINAKFETIPMKWADIWQNIETRGYRAFVPVFEQISRLANTPAAKQMADDIVIGMQIAAMAVIGVINNIEWLSNVIGGLYTQYQPVFDGLGSTLLYLVGVWSVYKAGVIAAAIATGIWGAAVGAAGAADTLIIMVTGLTRAFYSLGIAETFAHLAGKEMWFAILFPIAAVIGGVYLVASALEYITGASGLVAAAFEWLGALALSFFIVYGAGWATAQVPLLAHIALMGVKAAWDAILIAYAWAQNAAMIVQNAELLIAYTRIGIVTAATAIWTLVTQGLTAALRILNLTMFMNPIGMVVALVGLIIVAFGAWAIASHGLRNTLADVFEAIVDMCQIGVNAMIGMINGLLGVINKAIEGMNSLFGTNMGAVEIIEKVDLQMFKESGSNWIKKGSLSDLLPQFPDLSEKPEAPGMPSMPTMEDLIASSKDTADNTKGMKDAMEISDEDIKYMRDIAEQEVINKYTTAEVKIEMTNNNNVSSEVDIDGMVRYTNDSLIDAMISGAEAVHK